MKSIRTWKSPCRRRMTWKSAASRFTNHSDETRTIEVTSYAEIVLNTAAAEIAHPAFSNLFVQTQIIPQQNAILCSRRPRAPHEKPPWIGHLLLVHGKEIGTISFETDREKFIGRGGNHGFAGRVAKFVRPCRTAKARCSIRLPPSAAPSGSNRRKAPRSLWFPASLRPAKKSSA